MIHGQNQSGDSLKNVSSILQNSLSAEDFQLRECWNEETSGFTYGVLDKNANDQKPKLPEANQFVQKSWRDKAKLKRRGQEYFDKNQKERKEKIHYGLLVHEILAEIKTIEEANQLMAEG